MSFISFGIKSEGDKLVRIKAKINKAIYKLEAYELKNMIQETPNISIIQYFTKVNPYSETLTKVYFAFKINKTFKLNQDDITNITFPITWKKITQH